MRVWKFRVKKEGKSFWWLARSTRQAHELEWQIARETLPSLILENVKTVRGNGARDGRFYLVYLKMTDPKHPNERALLDQCLTEAGIGLIDQIPMEN